VRHGAILRRDLLCFLNDFGIWFLERVQEEIEYKNKLKKG